MSAATEIPRQPTRNALLFALHCTTGAKGVCVYVYMCVRACVCVYVCVVCVRCMCASACVRAQIRRQKFPFPYTTTTIKAVILYVYHVPATTCHPASLAQYLGPVGVHGSDLVGLPHGAEGFGGGPTKRQ